MGNVILSTGRKLRPLDDIILVLRQQLFLYPAGRGVDLLQFFSATDVQGCNSIDIFDGLNPHPLPYQAVS